MKSTSSSGLSGSLQDVVWVAVLLFLSVVTFYRVLAFGFTDVDAFSLINTGRVSSLSEVFQLFCAELMGGRMPNATYYRPFLSLVYGLEWRFWGLNPWGYHLVDILLHGCNAGLVFLLCRRLMPGVGRIWAFLAGLFFLWHPLQVENVPAIARLGDLLATFWIALSLWLFLLWLQKRTLGFYLGSFVAAVLAVLTKEPAIILIPLLFCAGISQGDPKKSLRETVPFWILALLFLLGRHQVLGSAGGYIADPQARSWIKEFFFREQFNILGHVFGLGLAGFSGEVLQRVVLLFKHYLFLWVGLWLGLLTILGIYVRRRIHEKVWCLLASFIALQAVMIHLSFFMFRYLYLTLVPLALLLVWEMDHAWRSKRLAMVSGIVALIYFAPAVWANPIFDFHLYRRWQESAEITQKFTRGLDEQVTSHPESENIFLVSIPYKRLYRPQNYFFWDMPQTQILLEHAVQDYLGLRFPARRMKAFGLSYLYLDAGLDQLDNGLARFLKPGEIGVTAGDHAEIIDYPWLKIPGRVSDQAISTLDVVKGGALGTIRLGAKTQALPNRLFLHFGPHGQMLEIRN